MKTYNINIFIHIPISFPNCEPDFYLERRGHTGINKVYLDGRIDFNTFKINIKKFFENEQINNNIEKILDKLESDFIKYFPIYRDNNIKMSGIPGKNIFDKKEVNIII